MTFMHMAD